MYIRFLTNVTLEGWSPEDYETGLGGSEEKLIELARALAETHKVEVYHSGRHGCYDNVTYRDYREFKPYEHSDVFVSLKSRHTLQQTVNADYRLHWSMENETILPWEFDSIDEVLAISGFHKGLLGGHEKIGYDYIWADLERLDSNRVDKKKKTMLYCSSFDRGLEELLSNWPRVQEQLGVKELRITYGWDFIDRVIKHNPAMLPWKERMITLLTQPGINLLGRVSCDDMCKEYWMAEYWVLPLNNAESELFCINAIKAQYCGAIPLVRRIGGLQETVHNYLDWDKIIGEKVGEDKWNKKSFEANRKHAEGFNLTSAMKRWEQRLKKKTKKK